MSRVLFSIWFTIQGIIQNKTCSIWFRIQRIIKTCPRYYLPSGSRFMVLFKIRHAASGSGFSVLFKSVQCIIQYLIHDSAYYSNMNCSAGSGFRVLLKNVWGIIPRLVQYSGYYTQYDLQRLVQDSAYY